MPTASSLQIELDRDAAFQAKVDRFTRILGKVCLWMFAAQGFVNGVILLAGR